MANCTECSRKLSKKFLSEPMRKLRGKPVKRYILCDGCKNVMTAEVDILGRIDNVMETPKDDSERTRAMIAEASKLFKDAGIDVGGASLTKDGEKIKPSDVIDYEDEDYIEPGARYSGDCEGAGDSGNCEESKDVFEEEKENKEEPAMAEKEEDLQDGRTLSEEDFEKINPRSVTSDCMSSDEGYVGVIKKEWKGPKHQCEGCKIQEELNAMMCDKDSDKILRGLKRLLLVLGEDK